jgi:VCBS repeat-containing protein
LNYAGKFGSSGLDSLSNAHVDLDSLSHRGHADAITVPDAHLLFSGDYHKSGHDLIISDDLHRVVVPNYFHGDKRPALISPDGAPIDPKVIDALAGHTEYAQAGGPPAAKVVGHVAKMTGSASIVRNGVTIDLQNGDAVYQSDVVQTGSGSTLGLVLSDGTTFNLSANARLMLNDLTFDASSTSNSALFTLVQGAASFVAGQIAKTGDMKIGTPVATMGIRGTAVILDISSIDGTVSISVVDQHDGTVHAVQVFNAQGIQIGTVTSNGTSLTLTPAANFNVIAQESNKTPAQIAQEFIAFQAALDTYNVQKAIDPNLPQHTDNGGNNANPQQTKFATLGSTPASSPQTEYHAPAGTGTSTVSVGSTTGTTTVFTVSPDTGPVVTPPISQDPTVPPAPPQQSAQATSIPFVVTPSTVASITTGPADHSGPVMSAAGDVVYDPDGIIYFYDRASGTTTRVTPANDGFTYSGQTVSSDGRYVVYQGTDGTHTYVYVWGTDPADTAHYHVQTQLVAGGAPAISGDGSTILAEQGGSSIGIFDLQGHSKGTITPAAIGATGTLWSPSISADGHVIAVWSSDSSTPGGSGHLYTYDVSTGIVTAIASTTAGAGTAAASISADGHYVVYQSQVPGGQSEISLYDLSTGHVVFTTANAHEILAGASWNPVISPDGHFIIFTSDAELTSSDTNSYADTYVVDVTDPAAPVYKLVSANSNAASDGGVAISAGDLYEAFASKSSFTGGSSGGSNIFIADPTSGHSAIIQETANSPDHLTATGLIEITGGSDGVTLTITDALGNPQPTDLFHAHFSADGQSIQWSFSEAISDFAALQYGQDSSQQFFVTLNYTGGHTIVPVTVTVHDAVQPTVVPADVAPVATPVTLADGHGDGSYTITAAALLAGVSDIDSSTLSITDVTIKNGGGALVHNQDGTWTYTPTAGFHGEVVFNYTASDGTLTSSSTADLSVVNDPATIDGVSTGNVLEDTSTTTGGKLTVHDIDPGDAIFQPVPVAALTGTYGNFTFDQISGSWNYALVHDKANGLAQGQVVHDTLTVTSADGTASQVIDVTITGTDDAPVATPVTLADGHGDGSYTITTAALLAGVSDIDSATLSITDVTIKNGGGALVHNQDGTWTYTPDPGFHGEVVFDYTASDGTLTSSSTANLDIVNDPATITGQATGSVVEDTSTTAAGTLTVNDIDPGEAVFQPVPAVALTGTYGNFTFDANTGAWTYALVHNEADGLLLEGQVVHDTLTVTSADGTASQTIDVTVTGTNDAPVITAGTVASGNIDVPFAATAHNTLSPVLASELHTSGLISGLPGESGFGTLALGPSDDGSSGAIDITSVFGTGGVNFFGHHYTSLYVNNNGNISFGSPIGAYTPSAIGSGLNFPIIAPFWADVDTLAHGGGAVSYDLDTADGVMTITWDHVGYYPRATNKLDTFQLLLINEGNGNFDIEYRYGDIQWTTGGASGGSNGLGGTAARAGYSAGDGSHYFEIPQSGNQSALLSLSSTPGNTGIAGVDHLEVRNGEVGPSSLTSTGTIDFSDPNLNDTHSIQSVTYTGSGNELGTLSLVKTTDTTGTGTGGQFVWTYTADPATVKAALDGTASHSKVETFDVVISDGHDGGTVTQQVSVTLTEPTVTVTVLTPDGLDFHTHNALKEMGAGTIQSGGSSTSFTILDSADNREFVIDGNNFTYSDGAVTGGTVTAFHEFKADGTTALADFTGLSVDAATWMSAVQQDAHGDKTAAEALTSAYAYNFIGGPGADNFGSAGQADTLSGTGKDFFDGGGAPAGSHDTLTGGAGSTFVFAQGYGALTITNFDQASGVFNRSDGDHIELDGFTGNPTVTYVNGNTVADYGHGDVLTLLNVNPANINDSDFIENGDGGGGNNGNGPVVSGADNTVAYTGTPVSLDQSVAVTDTTGTVTSVNVWISSGFQNGDSLSIDGRLDGDLFNPNDGSTIHYHYDNSAHGIYLATTSGTATLDDFGSALHLIQFWNAGSDPSAGGTDATRTVTWAAQDAAGATSPTATTTINVDDAPVIHFDNIGVTQNGEGATTVTGLSGVTQNSQGTTTITGLSVTDADAAAAENLTLTATTAGATSGTTVSPASPSGHLSDINATLQSGLTYDQGPTPTPTDMVTLTVADGHGATDTVHLIFNVAQNPAEPVTLAGTTGKDVFFGTGYQDQFVFAANSNHDTIMNFTPGQDQIDLSAVVTNNDVAGWMSQHVTVSPTNPSDALVSIDAADTIVLHGVSAASLTYHDFILHPGGGGGIS